MTMHRSRPLEMQRFRQQEYTGPVNITVIFTVQTKYSVLHLSPFFGWTISLGQSDEQWLMESFYPPIVRGYKIKSELIMAWKERKGHVQHRVILPNTVTSGLT